jgi:FMN phosphatase YigB (HAD superfamily)
LRLSISQRTNEEKEEALVSRLCRPRLLLSFDLDDTLWNTDQVVRSANEAMIQAMIQQQQQSSSSSTVRNAPFNQGPDTSPSTSSTPEEEDRRLTVEDFLATTRTVRKSFKDPMTYQNLRKLSIRTTFQHQQQVQEATTATWRVVGGEGQEIEESGKVVEVDEDLVNHCYNVWEQERHDAAERYLLPNAMEMLQHFKPPLIHNHHIQQEEGSQETSNDASVFSSFMIDICIVAITNGAGNPLFMPNTLQPYFDFCVSGEDPTVFPHRKPHSYIYQKALQDYEKWWRARQAKTIAEQNNEQGHLVKDPPAATFSTTSTSLPSSSSSSFLWCHVGDCLANDVSASADCGARAIWMMGSSSDDEDDVAKRLTDTTLPIPAWSTAPQAELDQRRQLIQEGKAKVTARIRNLIELPRVIEELLSTTGR